MSLCTTCDQRNPANARYCVHCGAPLDGGTPAPVVAPPRPASPPAMVPQPVPVAATVAGGATTLPINLTVTVSGIHTPAPAQVRVQQPDEPTLLVRALYFLFIGWWFSLVWLTIAWAFNATIIGLPVGLAMLNALPRVITLRPSSVHLHLLSVQGNTVAVRGNVPQESLALRAIYFVLVGWWLSLLWSFAAWGLCVSIYGMPLAFWMFDQIPTITTLKRY